MHCIVANVVHLRCAWDAKRVVNLMNKVEHSSGLRGDWMPAGGLILWLLMRNDMFSLVNSYWHCGA